jgi:hypothetical protein
MTVIETQTINGNLYAIEQEGQMYHITLAGKTKGLSTTLLAAQKKLQSLAEKGGDTMTALDKAREVANKLKAENQESEQKAVANQELAKKELAALAPDSKLAAMYNEAATVGAENIAGQSLPILRIHVVGKSTNNELEDGTEPQDGHFYYKPTKEDLGTEIDVHILTISRGFKTQPMEGSQKEYTFNQVVGGIIGNDKPFIMYFNGTRLPDLWNFGKEAGQYTRRKPVAFPMFSLKIRLTTKKGEKGKYAAPWIVDFKILRTEDGQPELILDEGEFQYLKDNVAVMEETIASLIAAKELKSAAVTPIDEEAIDGQAVEEESVEEIPFG